MLVTVPVELIEQALGGGLPGGSVYGRLLDEGDVAQVLGLGPEAGAPLGGWARAGEAPPADHGPLALTFGPQLAATASYAGAPVECEVVRARGDFGARMRGILPDNLLAGRCVAVIGLGSGGSLVAEQLARCGVGRMRLVDYDRLAAHNVARHACTMRDIGRYKTRAVRDLLLATSPLIAVETWEADVLREPVVLDAVVRGADLVVAATDKEAPKLAINRACWQHGVPAVYGAAYNRAFGGDIFRAVPPDGACYACLSAVIGELFAPPPTAAAEFSAGYADPGRMADLVAQPGLSMDIGMITMLTARVALETLLRDVGDGPAPLPDAWLLFGNRAEWVFRAPLERHFVAVPRRDDCEVCNYEASVRARTGRSAAEAARLADAILADLDDADTSD